jgi:glutamate racemase
MSRDSAIAVFDSGLGGLTVFQAIRKRLPSENFLYLADNKRMPYGSQSAEKIFEYTEEAISFLEAQNVKLIVFACHTVSSTYTKKRQLPIIDVATASKQMLKEIQNRQKVALLGTERTIQSHIYEVTQNVITVPCPKLAPAIESQSQDIEEILRQYLFPLKHVDALFLACTHYPLIRSHFEKVMGKIPLFDCAEKTAEEVENFLKKNNLLNEGNDSKTSFFVTDAAGVFANKASYFLQEKINAHLINLVDRNIFSGYKI